jgi:RNA polymerase sigma-70 factor (ECF subfamily)
MMPAEMLRADGVEAAWHQFADDLYRFISRRVASPQDAEDVLQLVFLRLTQQTGGLRSDERVAGWLFATTRNAITDYYRSAARRRELPVGVLPDTDAAAGWQDEDESEANLARCLAPLIEHLPAEQAEAVRLVDVKGMTHSEAAAAVIVSVPGMKSRVQRGRRKLLELLLSCCEVQRDVRGRAMEFDGCATGSADGASTTDSGCGTC